MWFRGLLIGTLLLTVVLSGCTSPRDIDEEAEEREEWAKEHNDYRPIAVLTGPDTIQPGALVWYSAHGSHDPDFFGAKNNKERNEAKAAGGFNTRDDASQVTWSWYVALDDGEKNGLGNGIRKYMWQIDNGPVLVAHELTHRYGSDDGPVRFPVGLTEEGMHTLRLTVVDWSGDKDTVETQIAVSPDGVASTVPGFRASESGWSHTRTVPVSPDRYSDCRPLAEDHDPAVHHMSIPWDLLFFADKIEVEATWDAMEGPLFGRKVTQVAATPPHDLAAAAIGPTSGEPALNLNDIGITLGNCETDGVWQRFDTDQDPQDDAPREWGEVAGTLFAQNVEKVGPKTERTADYDINVYLSDDGMFRGGTGGDVQFETTFVPATDTSYGGR